MGTDMGYEFSDGNFVSDVLLWSASATDFPYNLQREEGKIKREKEKQERKIESKSRNRKKRV